VGLRTSVAAGSEAAENATSAERPSVRSVGVGVFMIGNRGVVCREVGADGRGFKARGCCYSNRRGLTAGRRGGAESGGVRRRGRRCPRRRRFGGFRPAGSR